MIPDHVASNDQTIAELLEQAVTIVLEQKQTASEDSGRSGLLNSLELLLQQPLRAAHLLTDRTSHTS